ncbi:hypothetical protein R3P38DRAFT_2905811 [Favolaschia claudopus]|uniref:F-box domain-containing protein n=1 Tax=Favolaschia claudopus TaxID=2862362 RepID=A0AAW0CHG5_9AGAR
MALTVSHSPLLPDAATRAHIRGLLRTNAPVPDVLPFNLYALSHELARYDSEIARLEAQMDHLQKSRAAVQEFRAECISLLSPVRRLPAEILVKIFALCMSGFDRPFHDHFNEPSNFDMEMARLARAPLLRLSSVCAMWHALALGTPTLWNFIQVDSLLWERQSDTKPSQDWGTMLLTRAIERSGSSPLSVMIVGDLKGMKNPFKLLVAQSARWKVFTLWTMQDVIPMFANALEGTFPLLEDARINTYSYEFKDVQTIHPGFSRAPSLRNVELVPHVLPKIALPPLEQLRTFRCLWVQPDDFGDCVSFMARCPPSLVFRLHVNSNSWTTADMVKGNIRSIPRTSSDITSLSIEIEDTGVKSVVRRQATPHIFSKLVLPRLNELRVELVSDDHRRASHEPCIPWPQLEFQELSSRSSFNQSLRILDLSHVSISEAHLIECLAGLSSLEQLSISDYKFIPDQDGVAQMLISDNLFRALTLSRDDDNSFSGLVPRLCTLKCDTRMVFRDESFLAFLLSRAHVGPFSCDLYVEYWQITRTLQPSTIATIDELRSRQNLVFRVITPPR